MNKSTISTITMTALGLLSESALAHMSQTTPLQHAEEHLLIAIGVAVIVVLLILTRRRLVR